MVKRSKRKRTRAVKVCPQCESIKINYVAGMITGQKYKCDNCNYIGSLIFEKDIEIDDDE